MSEFLARLSRLQIRISVVGGDLKITAPKGALTADIRSELGRRKEELLALLGKSRTPARPSLPPIERAPRGGRLPLSFTQERIWFMDQLEPGVTAYNMWLSCRLRGPLDVSALERGVAEIVRRHEVLRTTFRVEDGIPAQVVADEIDTRVELADELPDRDLPLTDEDIWTYLPGRVDERFDLERGPLFRRPLLVRVDPEQHVLFIAMHHTVFDGVSNGIFFRELTALYEAFSEGRPSPLPELPVQYADYALWQRELYESSGFDDQLAYWRNVLGGGLPVLDLPTDRPRPAVQTHRGGTVWLELTHDAIDALEKLGNQKGATLFMVLVAAYKAFLQRYTGQEDVLVGTAVANRNRAEIENLIGFFVNTLVLRTDLSGDPSFRELMVRVRDVCLGALENQDMPFQLLVDELQPERSLSHTPLFQTLFVLDEDPGDSRHLGVLTVEGFEIPRHYARTDIVMTGYRGRDGFYFWCEYNADLFERETVQRMLGHYVHTLERVAAEPDRPLSEIPLLTDEERAQVLVEWNDTEAAYPDVPVHAQVEAQADRTPDATALIFPSTAGPGDGRGDELLTYRELERRANRLAHHLLSRGVRSGALVGLCLERSLEMVVAQHAILKAGAAYVPLDPSFPVERLAYMTSDAGLEHVVTTTSLAGLLSSDLCLTCQDAEAAEIAAADPERPARVVRPEDRMYVIYTSGSTGRPKGVEIEHRSVSNFLASMAREPGFDEGRSLLAVTTLSFDISVLELSLPLVRGGTVIVAPKEATGDGAALAALLRRLRPDVMQATPATWRMLLLAGWKGDPSLRIFCGGEALPRELADGLLPMGREVWNLYGPTEATIWSTVSRVEPGEGPVSPVSIGRPIANTRIYVLDATRRPAPVGVPGELWIAGDGLARGYLERPELTAERFVPDPFLERAGARMYRTGDLARWHADGALECLGRVDNQVKVRGFRIELGEIEAVLDDAPGVEQCVTVVREDRPGDRRLVAYVTAEEGAEIDADALRAHAGGLLPAYMVPSAFVPVEAFPQTPNRKVDRRALLALEPDAPTARREYVAPEGPLQTKIAAIYAEVLGIDRVGQYDDFFELGGNSLLTTQAMARIRAELEVDLPLRDMFEAASVRGLAERALAAAPAVLTRIEPVPRDGSPLPLSFTQQRLWFLDQLEPGNAVYNVWMAWTLRGDLDARAFERALAEIVRRHEVLRTHFDEVDGIPSQVIAPPESIVLVREEPPGDATPPDYLGAWAEQVERLVAEHARRPFDLARGPLVRPLLVRVGGREYVFCLSAHHTILDAWSMGRFRHELAQLYEAFRSGGESPLSELELQYADYAAWQREFFQGPAFEEQIGWWREQLSGAPVLALPTDRPRPAEQTYVGANATRQLSARLMRRVEELGAAENTTSFMVLLAGLNVLLHRYGGQTDLSVGSVVAGRARRELEELMGYFANTLVLRTDLEGDPSFRELLRRVREVCLDAYDRQDTPFEQLVAELQPVRDLSYTPLFQVLFVLDDSIEADDHIGPLSVEAFDIEGGVAHTDLTLWARRHSEGLTATFEYATDLWDQETVERMLSHFERLLEGAAAAPDVPVSRLGLLGDEERRALLCERNRTAADYPIEPVHAQFEAQVDRTPDATAVTYASPKGAGGPDGPDGVGDEDLSYRELDTRANRLARHLRSQGVEPGALVGLCLERSIDMLVAQLAIQKTGAAYVPLDPAFPPDRVAYMIGDADLASVVTRGELRELLAGTGARAIALDEAASEIAAESAERLALDVGADARMYVIYTSGSTGRPKGVELEHRSVSNFLASMAREPGLAPAETLLAVTTLSFDISVLELMLPLVVGARVVIASSETAADGEELRALLERLDPDVMQATPATWRMLMLSGWEGSPGLRIFCGGEALPRDLAEDLLPLGREVWNLYGPTETTVWSTTWKVSSGDGPVLIGRPIANTEVYVLDPGGQPTPEGVPGELWIGGDGLARGYLERPELTAERFVPDPFSGRPGARMYRTGDLARWNQGGLLECMGRLDNQVKLRGFRIEPGEIESVLAEDPGVRQCVAVVREDTPGDQRLVAYLVTEGGRDPDVASLRERARVALPAYMVPSAYAALEQLPLTPNGKVDRRALLVMGHVQAGSGVEFVAPGTPAEVALAEIWAELLGTSEVSVYDNFFDLGGHSLLSVQVMARVRDRLGVSISPRDLMLQNLGQLASVCEERLAGELSREAERHGPGTRLIGALTSIFRRRSTQALRGPGDPPPGPRGHP